MVQMVRLIRSLLLLTFCLSLAPVVHAQLFSGRSGGNVYIVPPNNLCLGVETGSDQVCFLQTGTNKATVYGSLTVTGNFSATAALGSVWGAATGGAMGAGTINMTGGYVNGVACSGAGSMTWPSTAGVAVYAGSNIWGTSLAVPDGVSTHFLNGLGTWTTPAGGGGLSGMTATQIPGAATATRSEEH